MRSSSSTPGARFEEKSKLGPPCLTVPWQHRQGRSLDDGEKAAKVMRCGRTGPFSTASQDADCGTARRGGRRRRTTVYLTNHYREDVKGLKTIQVHACRGSSHRCSSAQIKWATPDGWLDRSRKLCITELTPACLFDGGRDNTDDHRSYNNPYNDHSQLKSTQQVYPGEAICLTSVGLRLGCSGIVS